jgi:beta-lactamase class A
MHSVVKLPIAVAVLEHVQAGRLALDRTVTVHEGDLAPGLTTARHWPRVPASATLRSLLELMLIESDNTAADLLLDRVGGPAAVRERLQARGLRGIEIARTMKAQARSAAAGEQAALDVATPLELVRLLAMLRRGELLRPDATALLLDLLGRARTGEHRLRGLLPPSAQVAHKTGTGARGSVTNDIGLIALPGGRGHLAMAVMVAGSSRPVARQERTIAELARAAWDHHLAF